MFEPNGFGIQNFLYLNSFLRRNLLLGAGFYCSSRNDGITHIQRIEPIFINRLSAFSLNANKKIINTC